MASRKESMTSYKIIFQQKMVILGGKETIKQFEI